MLCYSNICLFSDSRYAIILFLLPQILKPTGRPQLPIAEAQDALVMFTTDVRHLKIPSKKGPGIIVVFKNITGPHAFEEVLQVLLFVAGRYYLSSSFLEALEQMFTTYWIFFTGFNKAAHNCLHFIMKFFFNMSYIGERCSPQTTKLLKKMQK